MAKIPVAPVGGESGGVVVGTYTGDGTVGRIIDLGFTPKAVIIASCDGRMGDGNNMFGGIVLPDYPLGKTHFDIYGKAAAEIVDGGFRLSYLSNYGFVVNQKSVLCYYIAFR